MPLKTNDGVWVVAMKGVTVKSPAVELPLRVGSDLDRGLAHGTGPAGAMGTAARPGGAGAPLPHHVTIGGIVRGRVPVIRTEGAFVSSYTSPIINRLTFIFFKECPP